MRTKIDMAVEFLWTMVKPLPAGITPGSIADTLKNGTASQIMALNGVLVF
jgi:hypothetical protein